MQSRKLSLGLSAALAALVTCCTISLASAQTASNHRAPTAPVFTSLVDFDKTNGAYPGAMSLIQATDGNFYGVTGEGGTGASCTYTYGCGTFFQVTAQGTLTTLYNFCALQYCADGEFPTAGVIQGTDGNFYGVTGSGGSIGYGTVFKITSAGVLTVLHSFIGSDGASPYGTLLGSNGVFYGTTYGYGSAVYYGTVFKITPSGTLTTLYNFCSQSGCTDGKYPYAGLIQASDGNFYGTTSEGGGNSTCNATQPYGCGTIFKITPAGVLTTLHSFAGYPDDGNTPAASLIQASDTNLYGTAEYGGSNNRGVAFKVSLSGTLTMIYSFCPQTQRGTCPDGYDPYGGLIQGTDGGFYGTALGGTNSDGVFFRLTSHGTIVAEHQFDSTDGANPAGGLLQATDGSFYGNTQNGGTAGYGTLFNLSTGLAPFVETQTSSGKVGASVTILGTNLAGATSVTFNGIAASFTVVSSSEITATVPTGATTGFIVVTTPTTTLTSNRKFRILN